MSLNENAHSATVPCEVEPLTVLSSICEGHCNNNSHLQNLQDRFAACCVRLNGEQVSPLSDNSKDAMPPKVGPPKVGIIGDLQACNETYQQILSRLEVTLSQLEEII